MYPDHKRTTLLKYLRKLEIEGRVTKKLSQEFSTTESRILGALSQLDAFFQNTLIQGHSRTAPETSRIMLGTNQGTNEDDSRCDPHPEGNIFQSQNTRNSSPYDDCDNSMSFKCAAVVHCIEELDIMPREENFDRRRRGMNKFQYHEEP